jgi:hypothetical protein
MRIYWDPDPKPCIKYCFMILNLVYCVQNGEDFESMVQGMVQETALQSQLAQQVISHLSLN